MGISSSHELLIEDLTETIRSMKTRLGKLETETAALRKSLINTNVAHNEHSRIISRLDQQFVNSKLLEEGRSMSVRHNKTKNYRSQSLVLK